VRSWLMGPVRIQLGSAWWMRPRWYKASLQEFESVIPGLDVTFSGPV
jgi:hypothetical protein